MLALSRLLAVVSAALSVSVLCTAPAHGQWLPQLHQARFSDRARHLQAPPPANTSAYQSYFDEGGFPKAGRTLEQKIKEAEAFLAQELSTIGVVGLGATVVYKDEVVLAKGYGLRQSNDSSSHVSKHTLFQIGSLSKTMIATGIALLVEDGKLAWRDPVKTHLPWLLLNDKYAEEHVTIGDLLSMNSGIGREPDVADVVGEYSTERAFVEALQHLKPEHSLREVYAYSNTNFMILGELIGAVSGQPWGQFLHERLWTPLGMSNTFASQHVIPATGQEPSAGHVSCEGEIHGPYDLLTSEVMDLSLGRVDGMNAAGSIISSPADVATFMRFLLNKGKVGDVSVLNEPATIGEMIKGKVALPDDKARIEPSGLHYTADGGILASGYGFDYVGEAMWGHAYYDKGGDVFTHHIRTGMAPAAQLGVAFMGNTGVVDAGRYLDRFRSYVMGIFLDVPKEILTAEYQRWRAAEVVEPDLPGAPLCGIAFWKDMPSLPISAEDADTLVGTYASTVSTKFHPTVVISRAGKDGGLAIMIGKLTGHIQYVGDWSDTEPYKILVLLNERLQLPILAIPAGDGSFILVLQTDYTKVT